MGLILDAIFGALLGAVADLVLKPPLLPGNRVPRLRAIVILRLVFTLILVLLTVWLVALCAAGSGSEFMPLFFAFVVLPMALMTLISLVIARGLAHEQAWAAWLGVVADALFVTLLIFYVIRGAAHLALVAAPVAVEAWYLLELLMRGHLN